MARTKQTARKSVKAVPAKKATKKVAALKKPPPPTVDLRVLSQTHFASKIRLVWRQVCPGHRCGKDAMRVVGDRIHRLARAVTVTARMAALRSGRRGIQARDVQTAVMLRVPSELRKHAVSELTKAICKATMNGGGGGAAPRGGRRGGRQTVSQRAGLQFGTPAAMKYLREAAAEASTAKRRGGRGGGMRVQKAAAIAVAAVAEYMAAEVLELAGNAMKSRRKKQLAVQDVLVGIQGDDELCELFNKGRVNERDFGTPPVTPPVTCTDRRGRVPRLAAAWLKKAFLHEVSNVTYSVTRCGTLGRSELNQYLTAKGVELARLASARAGRGAMSGDHVRLAWENSAAGKPAGAHRTLVPGGALKKIKLTP